MPCSRTQHGLIRVGLEPPTSGSGVRGINHQATALPCIHWRTVLKIGSMLNMLSSLDIEIIIIIFIMQVADFLMMWLISRGIFLFTSLFNCFYHKYELL